MKVLLGIGVGLALTIGTAALAGVGFIVNQVKALHETMAEHFG